jgi:hypothetical protein
MTNKLVSSFTGATTDLVKPTPEYILLNYIKTNYDANFDWSGSGAKPMPVSSQIYWDQWWSGNGPLSIDANNVYTSTEPQEIGIGMIKSMTDVRLDLFSRGSKNDYPLALSTVCRFIRQLIALNPTGLVSSGIHDMSIEREMEVPEQDPKSTIYHHQMTVRLIYSHQVVNI